MLKALYRMMVDRLCLVWDFAFSSMNTSVREKWGRTMCYQGEALLRDANVFLLVEQLLAFTSSVQLAALIS